VHSLVVPGLRSAGCSEVVCEHPWINLFEAPADRSLRRPEQPKPGHRIPLVRNGHQQPATT
jgi:hypothetical protein